MPQGIWEGPAPTKPFILHDTCKSHAPVGGIGCMPGHCSQCNGIVHRSLKLCTDCAENLNSCQVCARALTTPTTTSNPSGVSLKPFPVTHARCKKPLPLHAIPGQCECGVLLPHKAFKLCDSCSQLSGRCNRCGKKVRAKKITSTPTDKPTRAPKPKKSSK